MGLLAIALAQLMITLDVTIVNVGLPTIQAALHFDDAALSLLSTTFSGPRERGAAFAVYTGVASGGLPIGLILGGVLTEYLSWNWVFYINLPIAIAAGVIAASMLSESRAPQRVKFDVVGAVLATTGLVAIVYSFSTAAGAGWDAPLTLTTLVAGVVILTVFVITQKRITRPLLPLRIVLDRNRAGAYLAFMTAFIGVFALFLFISFYLQTIEDYSSAATGVGFLPMAVGVIGASTIVGRLTTCVSPRLLLATGLVFITAGMAWLTQLKVDSGYLSGVLPALIAVGIGVGTVAPVAVNLATFRITAQDAGIASAALNTAQQVGASLGTALLNTVAAMTTAAYVGPHPPEPGLDLAAQVHGYTQAATWAAGILVVSVAGTLMLVNARLTNTAAAANRD